MFWGKSPPNPPKPALPSDMCTIGLAFLCFSCTGLRWLWLEAASDADLGVSGLSGPRDIWKFSANFRILSYFFCSFLVAGVILLNDALRSTISVGEPFLVMLESYSATSWGDSLTKLLVLTDSVSEPAAPPFLLAPFACLFCGSPNEIWDLWSVVSYRCTVVRLWAAIVSRELRWSVSTLCDFFSILSTLF